MVNCMKKFIIMILLNVYAFSLTISDIKNMRENGVLVAFPHEKKVHTISRSMKPSKLIKANHIKLNNQSLYFIPSWLPKMTNLVKLELKNTKLNLKELAKLQTLTKLNTLDISDNPLFKKGGNLIDFLSTFSLNELYLSNTEGNSSDYNNIGSLGLLVKLNLSNNSISDIDGLKLQKLTKLKELSLANNRIYGVFDTTNLPKESLVKLDLSGNKIEKFGFSEDFPSLMALDISNNSYYMEFASEYNNPYLFMKLKRGKFNDDIDLPKSIMNRLGIKVVKSKWITPKKSICINHGGEIYDGACKSNWENAKKICSFSGGRLPTKIELKTVVTSCGGEMNDDDIAEWDRNRENNNYQSCYKKRGFTFEYYWSSTTHMSISSYAWSVIFYVGGDSWYSKIDEIHVRCVRDREKLFN